MITPTTVNAPTVSRERSTTRRKAVEILPVLDAYRTVEILPKKRLKSYHSRMVEILPDREGGRGGSDRSERTPWGPVRAYNFHRREIQKAFLKQCLDVYIT